MIASVKAREAARVLDENCCHFSQRIVINWAVADRRLEAKVYWNLLQDSIKTRIALTIVLNDCLKSQVVQDCNFKWEVDIS